MFLSSGDGYVSELLEFPFLISRENVGFLSRHCSGKGPHLALRGESRGFSRVALGRLGFFSEL